MSDRSDLIAEANDLGLTFKGNISNLKLKALVAAEYAGSQPVAVAESVQANPAVKSGESLDIDEDEDELELTVDQSAGVVAEEYVPRTPRQIAAARHKRRKDVIRNAKKRAYETRIVTLTNKDNRENDVMTTAYLSFENQYFGLSKLVPLDIPVELERSLIEIAASCTMTLHKDEIIDGKRTGNKVPMTVKKYAISYSRQDPK